MRGFRRLSTPLLGWGQFLRQRPRTNGGTTCPHSCPHGAGRTPRNEHPLRRKPRQVRCAVEGGRTSTSPALRLGSGRDCVRRIAAQTAPPLTDRRFDPSAAAEDGIYAYETRAGTRFRFVFRQSDGALSTRRGFTSRRAAATARRRLVESIERGEVKVARETFETFWLRLLEEKRPYMTRGSAEDFQAHGRKRLLPSLGAVSLARVDEKLVRRWMDEMVARVESGELAPKTVNNARTCLSIALNEAQRRGLLSRNPCSGVPALPVDRAELDYLRLDEIEPYLAACAAYYRPLASFLIGTGARISEALDVRFRHLDVELSVVRIYRQQGRRGDASQPTKGKRFRSVQIGPRLLGVMTRAPTGPRCRTRRLALPLSATAPRTLRRPHRADAAEPQDRPRLARARSRRRGPARHAAARAATHRRGRVAGDGPPADLRPAAARTPIDHHDRGALRPPRIILRPRSRLPDGARDCSRATGSSAACVGPRLRVIGQRPRELLDGRNVLAHVPPRA